MIGDWPEISVERVNEKDSFSSANDSEALASDNEAFLVMKRREPFVWYEFRAHLVLDRILLGRRLDHGEGRLEAVGRHEDDRPGLAPKSGATVLFRIVHFNHVSEGILVVKSL